MNKITSINFYDEESNTEYQLKLKIDNILLFRDSLVKRMRRLKVKVESEKLIKGQEQTKRLTEKHNGLFGFDSLKSMKVANKLGLSDDDKQTLLMLPEGQGTYDIIEAFRSRVTDSKAIEALNNMQEILDPSNNIQIYLDIYIKIAKDIIKLLK